MAPPNPFTLPPFGTPPAEPVAVLPVRTQFVRLSVLLPSIEMPPPGPITLPPVMVTPEILRRSVPEHGEHAVVDLAGVDGNPLGAGSHYSHVLQESRLPAEELLASPAKVSLYGPAGKMMVSPPPPLSTAIMAERSDTWPN